MEHSVLEHAPLLLGLKFYFTDSKMLIFSQHFHIPEITFYGSVSQLVLVYVSFNGTSNNGYIEMLSPALIFIINDISGI